MLAVMQAGISTLAFYTISHGCMKCHITVNLKKYYLITIVNSAKMTSDDMKAVTLGKADTMQKTKI